MKSVSWSETESSISLILLQLQSRFYIFPRETSCQCFRKQGKMTDLEKPAPVKIWFSSLEHHERKKMSQCSCTLGTSIPVV